MDEKFQNRAQGRRHITWLHNLMSLFIRKNKRTLIATFPWLQEFISLKGVQETIPTIPTKKSKEH